MLNRLLKRGETSGRSDDNINSIKKRFLTYENETKEIIKYYSELNKNYNVNSEVEPDQVFEEINKIFVKHGLAWCYIISFIIIAVKMGAIVQTKQVTATNQINQCTRN